MTVQDICKPNISTHFDANTRPPQVQKWRIFTFSGNKIPPKSHRPASPLNNPPLPIIEDYLTSRYTAAVGGEGERVMLSTELNSSRGAVAYVFRTNVPPATGEVASELREFIALPAAFIVWSTKVSDITTRKSMEKL